MENGGDLGALRGSRRRTGRRRFLLAVMGDKPQTELERRSQVANDLLHFRFHPVAGEHIFHMIAEPTGQGEIPQESKSFTTDK